MARRTPGLRWMRLVQRQMLAAGRQALRSSPRAASTGMPLGLAASPEGARSYRIFNPATPGNTPRPLMVMLHGCQQSAPEFAASTRMNQLAVAKGFAVVYPEQDKLANLQGCWNWFDSRSGRANREAASIMAAIDQACRLYRVDPQRIAVAGLSAGASMAALLALRYPQRFAAVVMHSGVDPRLAHSSTSALAAMRGSSCGTALPMAAGVPAPPLLVIHGSHDRVVAKANGMRAAQAWAAAAQAQAGAPRIVQRGQRYPITTMDWTAQGRVAATLMEVAGLGHAWSGGAKRPLSDPQGPDASRMAWAFALKQFATPL